MRILSKTGLIELSRKYRAILKKCALLNALVLGVLYSSQTFAAEIYFGKIGGGFTPNRSESVASNFSGKLSDSTITEAGMIYGGYSESAFGSKIATNNVLTIDKNVKLVPSFVPFAEINAGFSQDFESKQNILKITAQVDLENIFSSSAFSFIGGSSNNSTADKNTIFIDNKINPLYPENKVVNVYGGYSSESKALNNLAILTENAGGIDIAAGGASYSGEASNNTIILTGTTGDISNVYGGYTEETTGTIANNNSVVITNVFSNTNTKLYGTNISNGTNNSLEIRNKGINVASVNNFNNIYFVIPNTVDNTPLLTTTTPVVLDNVSIGISTQPGTSLNQGEEITLISATNGSNYQMADMNAVNLKDTSFAIDYLYTLRQEGSNQTLIATVTGKKANEETKALSEGQISSIALLNAGADLIANAGLENALIATKGVSGKVASFGAISGGYSKYKTGSHINLASASLLTGFSKQLTDHLTSSVFVEAGYGNYTTHNTFTKGKVKGDGDSKYYGLGVMGRYEMTKNVYADASVHGGYLNNDWKSNDTKVPVSYGTDSLYYGVHLGLGYETALNDTFGLNVYGKYFYTHQEGDDATIDGTKFDFKDINSHITRLGTRLFYNLSDKVKPFMGLAWDHEFNGKAKANAGDVAVDTPTLKGDTGMLELGLKTENLKDSAWDIDTSLQGFFGQREGVQGLVKAKYNF